jgi:succinyl-diaminopimelate desuccinylase
LIQEMTLERISMEAEKAREEVAALCSGLVQLNSAHPEGRTDECIAYIKEYLDANGVENEVHSNNPLKPNIVARIRGTTRRKVLWVGHLDVVPAGKSEGWTHPPYSGRITPDGRIYGRGSSDMKGACAAAMVAARILNQLGSLENTVEYWFTADEEIGGGDGARWLSETRRLSGDVCLIGDGNARAPATSSVGVSSATSSRTTQRPNSTYASPRVATPSGSRSV